ncbi:MAG TPA: flavoprotein [Desulfosporosinus sp.]|nr:flavoprotein [Desulfosporosinus sp.]
MNEELISQIVCRILSEPAFQTLLQGNKEGSLEVPKAVKLDALVLLNYVPDLEPVLTALKLSYGADYTLSILPSEQVFAAKPTLPEGLTWITPQDALSKTTWQRILIPTCSPNTLVKAALGLRDNPISEMIGRGVTQGIPTTIMTEHLGFTAKTPKAYHELYEGYLQTVQSYGVMVCETLEDGRLLIEDAGKVASSSQYQRTSPYEQKSIPCEHRNASDKQKACSNEVICYEKKYLADKDAYGIAEDSVVIVKRGTVISPLARDTLKSRRIELRQETEGGRL